MTALLQRLTVLAVLFALAACGGDGPTIDPPPDAGTDTAVDATGDATPDAGDDTGPDAAPDTTSDVSPDVPDAIDAVETGDGVDDAADDAADDTVAPGALTVLAPNGGESWPIDGAVDVTWEGGTADTVRVDLSLDGGASWSIALAESAPNDGSFTVARVEEWPSRDALVRVSPADDIDAGDISDAPFAIPPTLGILHDYNEALRTGCEGLGEDADGDGLFTSSDPAACPDVEAWLETDPEHADSDRDAVSDRLEVFGDGVFDRYEPIPDLDGDGLIAALDVDDDGDSEHDGLGNDADDDGVANFLEVYGYEYDALASRLYAWDGDVTADYYKSDPLQPSTDQDPYPDGMEVTGVLMDPSVSPPGDHPMIPGYPNIVVSLVRYDVTLDADITYTDGVTDTLGTTWTSEVESSTSLTEEFSWELGTEVGASVGITDASVNGSVSATIGGRTATTYTTTQGISRGTERVASTQWSEATSSNPSQTARIALYLKVENIGTSTASNIRPTFTLRIGDRNVTTFSPGGPLVDLLEPGGVYPSDPETFWVVDRRETAGGEPITLSIDELRALERGAPVVLDVTQLEADVYRQQTGGTWEGIGTWNQYMARIEAVAAHLVLDGGDGRMYDAMVYADDTPTSPVVTLRDAMIWVADAYDDPELGLSVLFPDEAGLLEPQSLDGWFYNFDGETFDELVRLQEEPGFNLLDLPLGPDSVVVAKARPDEPQPVIYWVAPVLRRDEVYAWVQDHFFGPDEITVELHVAGDDPRVVEMPYDPDLGVFVADVGSDYAVQAGDRVVARSPFYDGAEDPGFWQTEMAVPGYVDAWRASTWPFDTPAIRTNCIGQKYLDLEADAWSHCVTDVDAPALAISNTFDCPHCTQTIYIDRVGFGVAVEQAFCVPDEALPWGRMRMSEALRCDDWSITVEDPASGSTANFYRNEYTGLAFYVRVPDAEGNVRLGKMRVLSQRESSYGYAEPIELEYVVWDEIVIPAEERALD